MSYVVAVVGCTGIVGQAMIKCLEESEVNIKSLVPLASVQSVGKQISFNDTKLDILDSSSYDFSQVDFALFATDSSLSETLVKKASDLGCVCVDNSSFFRLQNDIPLIVPEVNSDALSKHHTIIANPNCSTIQLVKVLNPLSKVAPIKRVVVSTYQSVSGAGKYAMDELFYQTKKTFTNESHAPQYFTKQIAFNCIPHIDSFTPSGDTKEEIKIKLESAKIMSDDSLKISATCVRVPVFVGHCESVNIEFYSAISEDDIREALSDDLGTLVLDRREDGGYATPIDVVGDNVSYVSRIRMDDSTENAINLWIVADNVYCGAASNAVGILELLINMKN